MDSFDRIEDYAIIGDTHSVGLINKCGSLDWLCLPRFDSAAIFAKLLGGTNNGYFKIAPSDPDFTATRSYLEDTLVLETVFKTSTGSFKLTDFMPIFDESPRVVRIVKGLSGKVKVRLELAFRFDYGNTIPWVISREGHLTAAAGPEAVSFYSDVSFHGENFTTIADFEIQEGNTVPFQIIYHPSFRKSPKPTDAIYELRETETYWKNWISSCNYTGSYLEPVKRSLLTLKALTYYPTGGIVAAPTTSLPETLGGSRNWDYRYCWLRDASLTLESLLKAGFAEEALSFRDWLLRAVAGDAQKIQIMYGPGGERRLTEFEIDWLQGYENSKPVRIGNAASGQFQLDVYGELMSAFHIARTCGLKDNYTVWDLQQLLVNFVENSWSKPDDGIWEVRGQKRHFTHSKVMAWVAIDRAIKAVEQFGLSGDLVKWKKLRDAIKKEVLDQGWSEKKQAFTQSFGSDKLDASVLLIATNGFLDPTDDRILKTVQAIKNELLVNGFVLRYQVDDDGKVDGLSGREGAFLACSFWLVDALSLCKRKNEAEELFNSLLTIRNDVGLLSEEYDSILNRQVGNFPQAFSHISLVNSAFYLEDFDSRKQTEYQTSLREKIKTFAGKEINQSWIHKNYVKKQKI
jgi:GH15 family glucan-1,4-alpha-glucosidase